MIKDSILNLTECKKKIEHGLISFLVLAMNVRMNMSKIIWNKAYSKSHVDSLCILQFLHLSKKHSLGKMHLKMERLSQNNNYSQNIDFGYTLEPPHNLCFRAKIRKKINTPVNPSFTI